LWSKRKENKILLGDWGLLGDRWRLLTLLGISYMAQKIQWGLHLVAQDLVYRHVFKVREADSKGQVAAPQTQYHTLVTHIILVPT